MSASHPLPQRSNSGGGQRNPLRRSADSSTNEINAIAASPQAANAVCWITSDVLFHYQRCSRRGYLDIYGDAQLRDAPSDYLLKLREDSIAHRRSVMADYVPCYPVYAREDWATGGAATQALMSQGVEAIAGGVLLAETTLGDMQLVSQPDLLVKLPGWSRWGDWIYAPIDIKLGKKPKLDYQIVAVFHAYVLSQVQGIWPRESWLALRNGHYFAVDLDRQLPKFQEVMNACLADLSRDTAPEVFIAHSRCDLCHWYSDCYQQAQETQHLSLLPGVTPARYEYLKAHHLTTVQALAAASPRRLTPLPGFGESVAEKLVHQAQALLGNRAIARTQAGFFPLEPEDLPCAEVELYFDIEAAPDQNLIYLHGVLVVDHGSQRETFYPLVAETAHQEQQAWEAFLELVHQYPGAPIYHFCPYEAQTVRKLGQQYGVSEAILAPLLERFFDVHKSITEGVTLPIESYALKHIARWIGFNWRDQGANGAQSICWYNAWLETGDRAYLEAILRYNEDDCRATYRIKDWLVQFAQLLW